ncbi:MAG: CGNR zinc finger domain-containing protein [Gaiellaceae bacterium]
MRAVDGIPYPGERPPAPGSLALVQAFINTVDFEHGREMLADSGRLERHLHRLGLDPGRVGETALRRAHEVREALRQLALANNGPPATTAPRRVLERAARAARLTVEFTGGEARLVPRAAGIDAALGSLVAIVYDAMHDGTWRRFKACRRDVCHWTFWDASRNRSAIWCQMAVCGNRTKTRAYRRRRAST